MGAKSTVTLSRKEAESLLAEKWLELQPLAMSDTELEDELERLNDKLSQRGGFYQGLSNYLIR